MSVHRTIGPLFFFVYFKDKKSSTQSVNLKRVFFSCKICFFSNLVKVIKLFFVTFFLGGGRGVPKTS